MSKEKNILSEEENTIMAQNFFSKLSINVKNAKILD